MPRLALGARQELRAAPALLALARMLELTAVGLHEAVQEELAANPALEELEHVPRVSSPAGDDERLLRVAAPISLADALLSDLRASLPADEHPLAALLVGSLDEHGFLAETPASLARAAGVPRARVEAVLRTLRAVGPPGVATATPRDCLLAQLDALDAGEAHPLARAIVADHLDALGAARYRAIARALGADTEAVAAASIFIQRRLWPYPLQAALASPAAPDRRPYRTSDLIFGAVGEGFEVKVAAAPRRSLRLNPLYTDLAAGAAELNDAERQHVRAYLERARAFLRSLRAREETLLRVGEGLAVRQAAFLRHGPRQLAPLTRLQLARDLALHESTVCRAVAGKTARLPGGGLWPVDDFFAAARPAQELLRELVAAEERPLSDSELAALLAEGGFPIARRTVAKYRDQLGIPSQQQRAARGGRQRNGSGGGASGAGGVGELKHAPL